MLIARVALDVPLPGLFDYLAPGLTETDVGRRVVVSFGRRRMAGIVFELAGTSDYEPARLKPIGAVIDDMPAISADVLALWRFCSDYYQYPLGQTVFTGLPVRLRQTAIFVPDAPSYWHLTESGRAAIPGALSPRAHARQRLWVVLQDGYCEDSLLRELAATASATLKDWQQRGWVERCWPPASAALAMPPGPALNAEQQAALDAIDATAGFAAHLLHGVTGSGKTEVYLRLISERLLQGRQVLVLVPEINLTPQLMQRFNARFPGRRIATLHSALSDGERTHNWLAAQRGEADIVIGTRLAVFTPLPRLGMIVVDEEHDGSFKQQEGLRYSARDVAIYRARMRNVPIVLGSATPSLETWHNARAGRFRLLRLTQRAVAAAALPTVRAIDTRRSLLLEGFAPPVLEALGARLARGEQSLVFINRRGYAPVLFCGECGWLAGCRRCSAKLVLHLRERRLRCHHCGWEEAVPMACPECGNQDVRPLGQGTQRVEATLAQHFPQANVLRIDRDATRRKDAWHHILDEVHSGRAQILVGTQMLAKGHDFPNLSLVCVLNADGGLYSADFRAGERLFALLMQVAGRAGRAGVPGEVLIQTQFPDHPMYAALAAHDFDRYAKQQLGERRDAGFPPFAFQALLRAEAASIDAALTFLCQARRAAQALAAPIELFDPVPATMARLAGRERAQLLLQHGSRPVLQQFLRLWMPQLASLADRQVRWSLDVDPQEL